jgi:RHS repeat-associated protein
MQNFSTFSQDPTRFLNVKNGLYSMPFGVELKGRNLKKNNAKNYRYGYQGSEADDQLKGDGNSYTTEFRQLDPILGRWLSIDPHTARFAGESPYISMNNSPVSINDIKGLEGEDPNNSNEVVGLDSKDLVSWNANNTTDIKVEGEVLEIRQSIVSSTSDCTPSNLKIPVISIDTGESSRTPLETNNEWLFDENFIGPIPDDAIRISNEGLEQIRALQSNIAMFPGVTFVEVASMGGGSGMTIPPVIFLGPTTNLTSKEILDLKRHEYGHVLQFMVLGASMPTYLAVIGLPSLCSAVSSNGSGEHSKYWTETWANRLSYAFFGKPTNWDTFEYPLK